ncbi:MAG: hypothetical protein ABFQ89_03935, partial [Chloroflexota bacterium]
MIRYWHQVRRESLILLTALMEVCFLAPIMVAVSRFDTQGISATVGVAFFGIMLVPFYLARLFEELKLNARVRRDLAFVFLVATVLGVLRFAVFEDVPLTDFSWLRELIGHLSERTFWPRDLAVILTTLVFWWRGTRIVNRPLDVESVGYSFRAGVIAMIMAAILCGTILHVQPIRWIVAFFVSGLVAITLARAEDVSHETGGFVSRFGPKWMFSIGFAAVTTILLALLLSSLLSSDLFDNALKLLRPVWNALLTVVFVAVGLLFQLLYPIIQYIVEKLLRNVDLSSLVARKIPTTDDLFNDLQDKQPGSLQALQQYSDWLAGLAILLVVILVAFTFVQLNKARLRVKEIEVDDVEPDRGAVGLRARLLDRLDALLSPIRNLSHWRSVYTIRKIYARMVKKGESQGYPRHSSTTPFEHQPILAEGWPSLAD